MEEGNRTEPLFTNKCTYTKEVYRDSYLNFNKPKRTLFVIITSFFMLITLLELMLNAATFEINFAFFLLFIGLIVFLFVPLYNSNLSYKRSLEIYHEEIVVSLSFFEDRFVTIAHPSNATFTIQYSQLKRVIATKKLYLLVVHLRLFYIIDKNGFDKINMLEFEQFLHQKAPKAKFTR